jgi:hypothetical protein
MSAARYAIGDLARLAGVSRRTVRYYVQENLIPPPLGVGRGNHYSAEHLDQILRVKAMQEAGKRLDQIRDPRGPGFRHPPPLKSRPASARMPEGAAAPERSIWRRLTLAPGVELQIAGSVRLPPPGRLQELAAWCRLHLISTTDPEDEGNDA